MNLVLSMRPYSGLALIHSPARACPAPEEQGDFRIATCLSTAFGCTGQMIGMTMSLCIAPMSIWPSSGWSRDGKSEGALVLDDCA